MAKIRMIEATPPIDLRRELMTTHITYRSLAVWITCPQEKVETQVEVEVTYLIKQNKLMEVMSFEDEIRDIAQSSELYAEEFAYKVMQSLNECGVPYISLTVIGTSAVHGDIIVNTSTRNI